MNNSLLVFDMDGVLADVRDSYLASIEATVLHFTGKAISPDLITSYKKAGGWNNDWALAQKLIFDTARIEVPYHEVVEVFQAVFLGRNHDGLINRETWIPQSGLLERLSQNHSLGVFSGRTRFEIDLTLSRFASEVEWATIIADAEVANPKPAPDGLHTIAEARPKNSLTYIGDNIDDARSARAAGVRFIGIADGDEDLARVLRKDGAVAVIRSVNELEGIL